MSLRVFKLLFSELQFGMKIFLIWVWGYRFIDLLYKTCQAIVFLIFYIFTAAFFHTRAAWRRVITTLKLLKCRLPIILLLIIFSILLRSKLLYCLRIEFRLILEDEVRSNIWTSHSLSLMTHLRLNLLLLLISFVQAYLLNQLF